MARKLLLLDERKRIRGRSKEEVREDNGKNRVKVYMKILHGSPVFCKLICTDKGVQTL